MMKRQAGTHKKPKVKPVVAKQAKELKKQMKTMSIGGEKKINMNDESESSSDEANDDEMKGGQTSSVTKKIKKTRLTRADYNRMKKKVHRIETSKISGCKRRADKLRMAQQELIDKFDAEKDFDDNHDPIEKMDD